MVARLLGHFVRRPGRVEDDLHFDIADAGQWSFTFGTEEPIAKGLKDEAGLKLKFTRAAFEQFVAGTLDVGAAVSAKQVTAVGTDFMLLESFGRILRPPQDDLGWDTNTTG